MLVVQGGKLVVQRGAKDGDGEVGEARGAFVELEKPGNTVLIEIAGDLRFADAQMFSQPVA